jgi:hypothetical protein
MLVLASRGEMMSPCGVPIVVGPARRARRPCLGRRHGCRLERERARHALAGERCGVRGGGRQWRCAASRGTSAGGHYRCELSGGRRKERLLGRRATINHVSGNHPLEVDVVACHRLAESSASSHHRPSPHSTCGARGRCGRPDLTPLPGVCLIPGPASKPRPAQRICSATRDCSQRDQWIRCTTRLSNCKHKRWAQNWSRAEGVAR